MRIVHAHGEPARNADRRQRAGDDDRCVDRAERPSAKDGRDDDRVERVQRAEREPAGRAGGQQSPPPPCGEARHGDAHQRARPEVGRGADDVSARARLGEGGAAEPAEAVARREQRDEACRARRRLLRGLERAHNLREVVDQHERAARHAKVDEHEQPRCRGAHRGSVGHAVRLGAACARLVRGGHVDEGNGAVARNARRDGGLLLRRRRGGRSCRRRRRRADARALRGWVGACFGEPAVRATPAAAAAARAAGWSDGGPALVLRVARLGLRRLRRLWRAAPCWSQRGCGETWSALVRALGEARERHERQVGPRDGRAAAQPARDRHPAIAAGVSCTRITRITRIGHS
mmetsp:Transcript_22184/g.56986  ORF Transcript_22184/g.56986 Transcript_22184/m.56986 type:complete len:348 (+) Transcript_22184:321-1364(+)